MKYNICNVNEGENLFFTILWYILEKDLTKSGENIIDGGIITNNIYFDLDLVWPMQLITI